MFERVAEILRFRLLLSECRSETIEVQWGPRAAGLLQSASNLPLMTEQLRVPRLVGGYRSFRKYHG